ncbi:MAG: UDP-glucose 4-epimerase [Brevibacillus sp.]|nr:UDP-glucose 4-epimerase [Brevibacillus sp.]
MVKVLVTGGAGFIGSHILDLLIAEGLEVVVIDNFLTGHRKFVPPDVKLFELDITSPLVENVFAEEKPDYVIHLAAQIDVAKSIQDPVKDARHNILGTIRVLHCCHKFQVRKIIFSSSCAVYGETADCSITESFPIQPLSFYGVSKQISEMYIQFYQSFYGLPFTILRYANVYGPRQGITGEGGVVSIFLQKWKNQEAPLIYGTGEQTRDFVYVKDVAAANVQSLRKGKNEIINIGSNQKTSIKELLRMMVLIHSADLSPVFLPGREGDIPHSRLNNAKAQGTLGWVPRYDLRSGLTETYKYFQL